MDDIKTIANERDNLMQILAAVRVALRVPDDVDIVVRAQAVAAKAAQWDEVSWSLLWRIAYPPSGWPEHNDVFDVRTWYDTNKPDDAP